METHTQKFKVRLGIFIAGGLLLFVIAIFWGVILLVGKIKALTKDHDIDVIRFLTVALQILAVLVIVLLLVNV